MNLFGRFKKPFLKKEFHLIGLLFCVAHFDLILQLGASFLRTFARVGDAWKETILDLGRKVEVRVKLQL